MTRINKLTLQAILPFCLTASGFAIAADNCTGTYTDVNQTAEKLDLGKGITLTSFSSSSSNSWNNKEEVRAGGCSAYMLTLADGKFRIVYACARKDKNGDIAVDEGSLEPGAERGTWKVTSGTGALAKEVGGSGWWKPVVSEGKVTIGTWGGNCK